MSEKKTETFEHIGTMAKAAEMATVAAVSALPREQSDAFYADLGERKGALEVEFVVNGFPMKFSAFCNKIADYVAGINATFDARVEKAAGEMLLQRASDLQRRMTTAVDALRRAMEQEVYREFPAAMEDE